jgi:ribonuclease HI
MENQLNFFNKNNKEENNKNIWEVFVDGASRGNPGKAGAGVYIKKNNSEYLKKGFSLGIKTNNQAEYLALAIAIYFIKQDDNSSEAQITFTSDSELLIKQMNGLYKVKNEELKKIKNLIDDLINKTSSHFKHVLREKNKIADQLANEGIDKKNGMPSEFTELLKKYNIN